MAYTPELPLIYSKTLRRIAWSLDKPMTQTLELAIRSFAVSLDAKKICVKCRDNSFCVDCVFSENKDQISGKDFL